MSKLARLLESNRRWAAEVTAREPGFFQRLRHQQRPEYLWIGCADSRVPANQITGLMPGELFVHRNVANVVVHTDLNCLAVLQYAVDVLRVQHVIVCGHYGCGGVEAALGNQRFGLIDNWLRHVRDVAEMAHGHLDAVPAGPARANRLCELNVIAQVVNVAETTVMQDAWLHGRDVTVHGWIYGIEDGLLHDLDVSVSESAAVPALRRRLLGPS